MRRDVLPVQNVLSCIVLRSSWSKHSSSKSVIHLLPVPAFSSDFTPWRASCKVDNYTPWLPVSLFTSCIPHWDYFPFGWRCHWGVTWAAVGTQQHPLPFSPTFQTTQTCLPRQWGQEGCPCLVKSLSHLYVLFFIIFYLCVKSLLCTKMPKEDRFMFHTRWPIQKALSPIWHYVCVPLLWIIKTVPFKKYQKGFTVLGLVYFWSSLDLSHSFTICLVLLSVDVRGVMWWRHLLPP